LKKKRRKFAYLHSEIVKMEEVFEKEGKVIEIEFLDEDEFFFLRGKREELEVFREDSGFGFNIVEVLVKEKVNFHND